MHSGLHNQCRDRRAHLWALQQVLRDESEGERSRRHRINPIPLNPSKNQKAGCSPGSLRRETNMKTKRRQSTYIQSAVLVTEPLPAKGKLGGEAGLSLEAGEWSEGYSGTKIPSELASNMGVRGFREDVPAVCL